MRSRAPPPILLAPGGGVNIANPLAGRKQERCAGPCVSCPLRDYSLSELDDPGSADLSPGEVSALFYSSSGISGRCAWHVWRYVPSSTAPKVEHGGWPLRADQERGQRMTSSAVASPSSLADLIAEIWAADTFDEVAEAAADAIVAGGGVSAARVRLWGADGSERAVTAVGGWPTGADGGIRRRARLFGRKPEPEERLLHDKSGHPLGVLTTREGGDPTAFHRSVDPTQILAAQAGLAAGYLRLLERYRRLEHTFAAERAELQVMRRAWRIALDEAPVGMFTIDLQPSDRGAFLHVNDAFCEVVGAEQSELIGGRFEEFIHPGDRDVVTAAVRRAVEGRRTPANRRVRLVRLGDQACWVQLTITPVFDEGSVPVFAVCHVESVEAGKATAASANPPADGSHTLLDEKIRLATKRADRYQAVAALLLCDLGDLTQAEGLDASERQRLVATLAERMRGVVRVDDTVSHVDDHTLALLLDDLDPRHAHTVAERVRKKVAELVAEHGGEPSVGVTLIDSASDPFGVFHHAAAAMRQARTAPSRVVLYARSNADSVSASAPARTTTGVIRNRARRGAVRNPS